MSEVAEFLTVHPSVVSRHLAVLQAVGLIKSRRRGAEVLYSLTTETVIKLLETADLVMKQIEQNRR